MVAYLRDLSRFADVYYLADCPLEAGELDKLAPYTKGRWAIRHGRYDFGSYSMLARDLVGWDVIEQYDELMLANDSCYLVQPFDQVFAGWTPGRPHWWGLQATYDDFTTWRASSGSAAPCALDEVEDAMRTLDLWRVLRLHPRRLVLRGVPVGGDRATPSSAGGSTRWPRRPTRPRSS